MEKKILREVFILMIHTCIKLKKRNRVKQRADAERGEGEKKTRGKRKGRKWSPIKICTATLSNDNTFKNEARTLSEMSLLMRLCAVSGEL